MSNRDEFSLKTKQALAERVGYRCSFPGCFITTIGPSEETVESVSNTGMACHIAAAAGGKGARRYVASMSSETRSSISNGIWMCYRHGKLIDTDETRFTIEMLNTWKKIAEQRARLVLDHGEHTISTKSFSDVSLAKYSFSITKIGEENRLIGQAIDDSCIPIIWGDDIAHALRDFIIETCRNALDHGKARDFTVEIDEQCITISDDGKEFDHLKLVDYQNRSGGTDAIKYLIKTHGKNVLLTGSHFSERNRTTISLVRSQEDVLKFNPCSYKFPNGRLLNGLPVNSDFMEECNTVYFVLPDYCSLSDIYGLEHVLEGFVKEGRSFSFFANRISPFVQELIIKLFPNSKVFSFE